MKVKKVKAKTPVRYKGETIVAGQEFEITAEDFELHAGIFEALEEEETPKATAAKLRK